MKSRSKNINVTVYAGYLCHKRIILLFQKGKRGKYLLALSLCSFAVVPRGDWNGGELGIGEKEGAVSSGVCRLGYVMLCFCYGLAEW